jgi:hypothetical protein
MVGLSEITMTQRPHSLISVVHAPADKEAWVESAWRTPEITDLAPTEALLDLIERCGLPITVGGGSPALFVAEAVTATQAVAAIAAPTGATRLEVFVRSAPDGWHTSWAYAIDTGKYLSSIQNP